MCVAEGRVVMTNKCYAVPEGASQSGPSSLQSLSLTSKMVILGHSVAYKNFYALLVFLLTLPVKSASCERAHSKVDLVKSAVRASMSSERLEHLVLISSEKSALDSVNVSAVVSRFAALENRKLPL